MGSHPNYGNQAVQAERQRQDFVNYGGGQIEQAFKGFDPAFYQKRAQDYINYAMPQVADQYRAAKGQVGFGLTNQGLAKSSVANKGYSDLSQQLGAAQRGVVDTGIGQAQDLQKQIEQQKTLLLGQVYQGADPANAIQQSIASAASFATPSVAPAIANTFSNVANQYYQNQMMQMYNQMANQPRYNAPQAGINTGALPSGTDTVYGGRIA